jgi:hypothetical protein
MMRVVRIALLCTTLLSLARCNGWLPPFETVPPQASGESEAMSVAVCYNALTASPEQLLAIAAASCGPGPAPQPAGRDITLSYCPLFTPARATFACAQP